MAAVLGGIGVQGAGLAPDRHPTDPRRASAKTRVSDPEAAGLGQVGLVLFRH